MPYQKEDTIFVQIASYRDSELQHTLQDLFAKAKHPENIFVGICHQYDLQSDADKHLFAVPFSHPKQLRIDEVDYRDSQGCCWARKRVQKLWENEKWTLMIDSHMRFEPGWDETCVLELKKLQKDGIKKPILSSYVCSYKLDGTFNKYTSVTKCDWFNNRVIKCIGYSFSFDDKAENYYGSLIAGHFLFADAEIISDIAYDPHLYFVGEEVSLAARFWTKGYNIIVPTKIICYHFYQEKTVNKTNSASHYRLHNKNMQIKDENSLRRVEEMFQSKKYNDPQISADIDKYGLGDYRTLKDYERFSGIDFSKKKIREHTKKGIFEEWQEVAKTNVIKKIFQ